MLSRRRRHVVLVQQFIQFIVLVFQQLVFFIVKQFITLLFQLIEFGVVLFVIQRRIVFEWRGRRRFVEFVVGCDFRGRTLRDS